MMKYLFLSLTIFSMTASAFVVDLNLNTFDNKLTTSSSSKNSRLFGSVGFLADISRSDSAKVTFGWSVLSVSLKNETGSGATENLSSLEMGPALRWTFDHKRLFSLTAVYAIYAKGKFDTATTSENISGNSYLLKLSIEPEVAENVNLGFALNYYASSYNLSVQNSTESSVSYKNTWFFPSISMALKY